MIDVGSELHARRIAREVSTFFNPECDRSIVRTENGELLGGVIYQGYTGASIRMHVAGFNPRWIDRDMLWMAFYYPFEQLGVSKVLGFVHSTNLKALDFNRKLGFKEEARVTGVFRDADLVIVSMRREDCPWLKRGHRRGIFRQGTSTARTEHAATGRRREGDRDN